MDQQRLLKLWSSHYTVIWNLDDEKHRIVQILPLDANWCFKAAVLVEIS